MRVRCVTLNLQGLGEEWFTRRAEVVIKGLRKYRPDVVCLQECTVRYAGELYQQAAAIGEGLGLRTVAFSPYGNPIEVMSADQGGIAIIARAGRCSRSAIGACPSGTITRQIRGSLFL
ncbi:MAG TPA: endonuclease/exonuclease/phosphatase family protein [Terriglobales bacterium]|nr:endonuclease/exonuclease/phosphatase family protein [Terriglobales bacterium]